MSSVTKWKCPLCTYENWPAAVKCTLCRSRPIGTPTEENNLRLRVSPKEVDESRDSDVVASSDTDNLVKCFSCTYLNKPKSFKCEQCFHVLQDPAEPNSSASKCVSSVSSDSHTYLLPESGKWSCPHCTYENWPKSKFCVMCLCPPASNEICPSEGTEDSSRRIINPSQLSSIAPCFLKPRLSFRDKVWLAACRAVLENEVIPIERYLLAGGRIDKKLTKQDCRYLSQMSSTELNDSIRTGYSMKVECSRLGHETTLGPEVPPSDGILSPERNSVSEKKPKLRSGLTLVDLAIQFGRADLINLFIALSGLQATSAAISSSCKTTSRSLLSAVQSPDALSQTKSGHFIGRRQGTVAVFPSLQQLLPRTAAVSSRVGSAVRSKWMPCQASPQIAKELRNFFALTIKHNQGVFPCAFLSEWGTFALPHTVAKFPPPVKYLLLSELCDTQAQTELEDDAKAINWWFIPGQKQASRLFALWNRTAGDCLLDSVLQACWGIFDRDCVLRRTLAESLRTCESSFYSRWRDYEAIQAACHYILDESQCKRDWDNVLATARQQGGALEQIHIFALSHILRRPIIVYGVKYIKNYLDEPIGIANFQGIYLPLLWDRSFCSRNPIVLGYTRGHFTALVPMEPPPISTLLNADYTQTCPTLNASPFSTPRTSSSSSRKHSPVPSEEVPVTGTGTEPIVSCDPNLPTSTEPLNSGSPVMASSSAQHAFVYLPLVDRQGSLLPVHFTTEKEANFSHSLLREWLDVVYTRRGLPLARLRLHPRHWLVDRMVDDWLSSYRSLAKLSLSHTLSGADSAPLIGRESRNSSCSSVSSSASLSSSSTSLSAVSEGHERSHNLESDNQHSQSA